MAVTSNPDNRPLSRIRSGRPQSMRSQMDKRLQSAISTRRDNEYETVFDSSAMPSQLPEICRRPSTGALLDVKLNDRRASFSVVFGPHSIIEHKEHTHQRPSTTDNHPRRSFQGKSFSHHDLAVVVDHPSGRPTKDPSLSEETVHPPEIPPSTPSEKDPLRGTVGEKTKSTEIDSTGEKTTNTSMKNPPRLLERFDSSGDFKAALKDLYGKKKDADKAGVNSESWLRLKRLTNLSSRLRSRGISANPNQLLTLRQKEENAVKLKAAAARGWRIIRRYVEDRKFEKHTSGASMGWAVLKQHLNNMSDVDTRRRDLYQRYGVVPTKQSDGSFKITNVMRVKTRFKTTGKKNNPNPPKCSRENTQINLGQLKI